MLLLLLVLVIPVVYHPCFCRRCYEQLPAPWVPPLDAPNDISHFDPYTDVEDEEEEEDSPLPSREWVQEAWCRDF